MGENGRSGPEGRELIFTTRMRARNRTAARKINSGEFWGARMVWMFVAGAVMRGQANIVGVEDMS